MEQHSVAGHRLGGEDPHVEMTRVAEGQPSISAKIRALDAAGYGRADIARFLGKRYQHVRNVLVRGHPRSRAARDRSGVPDAPGEVESRTIQISADGRIVIPAAMRSAMLIDESGHLTARVVDGELRVLAPKAALFRLRGMMRDKIPDDTSVVDELIAERRAEARAEERG